MKQQQLEFQQKNKYSEMENLLAAAKNNQKSARNAIETKKKNWEQARNIEKMLRKNFETDSSSFTELLEIQELQLDIKLNLLKALGEYYQQTAILKYLIPN